MTKLEIARKIEDKMIADGWSLVKAEYDCGRPSTTFERAFARVSVAFEMCSCHGGRVFINEEGHDNNYYEISHGAYDESLGITDPESELLWEIDNELIDRVDTLFSKMTFKVAEINKYVKGEYYHFFQTEDEAFEYLTEGKFPKENLHTFEEGVIDYPNEKCHAKVTRVRKEQERSWDRNKYWFKVEKTDDDWKTIYKTYEAYIEVFEK